MGPAVSPAWPRHQDFGVLFKNHSAQRALSAGSSFKVPTQQAEDLFVKSIDATITSYSDRLKEVPNDKLQLDNKDCDTGKETRPGEYVLSDRTYARLLADLSKSDFKLMSPELQQNILAYYKDPNAPQATKRKAKDWEQIQENLAKLKTATPLPMIGEELSVPESASTESGSIGNQP